MSNDALQAKLPEPGMVIDRKYEIAAVIGRGGMGVVFEATHLKIQRRVALKMLHPALKSEPGVLERFEREARAAGQLRSPFIARILDVETSGDLPYIVMELLEGRDLEEELTTRKTLPISDAVAYVLQACSAMSHAHSLGIIHRDLKPANLYLCETADGGPTIKLLDFGISKITTEVAGRDGRLTAAMTTLGSPVYMSPEQLRGAADVDHRADIWSLGVILYELLAGRPPFMGTVTSVTAAIIADAPPNLVAHRPDVPTALEAVVLSALQKKPDDRCNSAADFAAALMPFASDDVVKRVRATFSLGPPPPSSRRRTAMGMGSAKEPPAIGVETLLAPAAAAAATKSSETRHSFASIPDQNIRKSSSRTPIITLAVVAVIVLGIVALTQFTKKEQPPVTANVVAPPASIFEPQATNAKNATSAPNNTNAPSAVEPPPTRPAASASANMNINVTSPTPTPTPRTPPRPAASSPVRGDPKNPIHL